MEPKTMQTQSSHKSSSIQPEDTPGPLIIKLLAQDRTIIEEKDYELHTQLMTQDRDCAERDDLESL